MNAHVSQGSDAAEASLPVGTATFLFADVEGSTQALERHGEAYAHLLGRFRSVRAALIAQSGGTLVQTAGDGLFAVFPTADEAMHAAVLAVIP